MPQPETRRVLLDLLQAATALLRAAARRHGRTMAAEAVSILEGVLRPGRPSGPAAGGPAAEDPYKANLLHLDLPAGLIGLLQPLADRDFRSVPGEAVFILHSILR